MSKAVLILGMHRSGTSALAGMLFHAGLSLGEKLLQADRGNTKGYFEDLNVLNINKALLRSWGMSWRELPECMPYLEINPVIKKDMGNLVQRYISNIRIWAWKEPRLSITLPFWYEHLRGVDTKVIVIKRNHDAIAQSLYNRNKIDLQTSRQLCKTYESHISCNLLKTELNSITFNYEDLIASPQNILAKIETFTGIRLDKKGCKFIDPRMRHNK